MAFLCRPIFSHQTALRPISFHHALKHATHPLRRAPIISRHRAHHVTPSRVVVALGTGLAGTGLGLSCYANLQKLNCDPGATSPQPVSLDPMALPPPPESTVNMYHLTFGTVCGVCAGVFIKKGAKALAFLFGGIFVLLQYLSNTSIIKIDWSRAAARFEGLSEVNGTRRRPTIYSLWRWLVEFLTADFQPRASFIAGFALGMRVG